MKALFSLVLLVPFNFAETHGQTSSISSTNQEQISEVAKRRAYKGGHDEESLTVVEEFKAPYRVVNKRQIQQSVYESVLKGAEEENEEGSVEKKPQ